ncbi:MAG TPA: lysophospholipid acyltransferase family protein, partial [Aggregatilineaceae bacterium]|nr:lysophospholipid acyltransferase family protein [Aggregatilineaceae bacterium]
MLDRRARWTRRLLRFGGRLIIRLLTRTTITGQHHLSTPGPVLYTANHLSTFDALLSMTLMPFDTVFVGPGDFKLLWPGDWIIRHIGLIPMKRGSVDRDGLKQMIEVLKSGGRLSIFPEGGTWEKSIDDVKSGASYLSQMTGAAVVPMGFGGTYLVWDKIVHLRRPRITITIG